MARTKTVTVPEVGGEAPEFNLPSAQGGQLRLSMRTARGPVILVFHGSGEEDVRYFRELAGLEDEINMAGGTVVGIGVFEPDAAREFVRKTGLKSYLLYDYARAATRDYGLLERSKERGEYARPAAFVVGGDHKVVHAWVGERPEAGELLAKVSGITGLPKSDEPAEESQGTEGGDDNPAGEARKKAPEKAPADGATEGEKPKKMSAEERERIKAERRAARAEGKSLKQPGKPSEGGGEAQPEERKRISPEERERRRAERRAAREAEGAGETTKPEAGDAKGDAKGDAGEEG